MKKTLITLFVCALSLTGFAQLPTKKVEKIRQMLELTGSGKLGAQVAKNIIPSFQKVYPNVEQKFWDAFMKEIKPEDLVAIVVPIYDKYYTEEEIDQLLAFYNTPIGKKMIATMPQISQESMAAGQAWGKQLGEKVVRQLKEQGYLKEELDEPKHSRD